MDEMFIGLHESETCLMRETIKIEVIRIYDYEIIREKIFTISGDEIIMSEVAIREMG